MTSFVSTCLRWLGCLMRGIRDRIAFPIISLSGWHRDRIAAVVAVVCTGVASTAALDAAGVTLAGWISSAGRIASDIAVGVHALGVALLLVGGQEAPDHRIIIARVVIIQAGEAIGELTGITLTGSYCTRCVAFGARGAVDLFAEDGALAEAEQDAALGIRQIVGGGTAVAGPDEMACQAVVAELAAQGAGGVVAQFLQAAIGIGCQAGGAGGAAALEYTGAAGVVDVPFVVAARVPVGQPVERVIAQRSTDAVGDARGLVAPGVVASRVDAAAVAGAGVSQGVDPGEPMGMAAVAVEILVGGSVAVERPLPGLTQVGVDIGGSVACSAQGVTQGLAAAGAVVGSGLTASVA